MRRNVHVLVNGGAYDSAFMTRIETFEVGATTYKTDSKRSTGYYQRNEINVCGKLRNAAIFWLLIEE